MNVNDIFEGDATGLHHHLIYGHGMQRTSLPGRPHDISAWTTMAHIHTDLHHESPTMSDQHVAPAAPSDTMTTKSEAEPDGDFENARGLLRKAAEAAEQHKFQLAAEYRQQAETTIRLMLVKIEEKQ